MGASDRMLQNKESGEDKDVRICIRNNNVSNNQTPKLDEAHYHCAPISKNITHCNMARWQTYPVDHISYSKKPFYCKWDSYIRRNSMWQHLDRVSDVSCFRDASVLLYTEYTHMHYGRHRHKINEQQLVVILRNIKTQSKIKSVRANCMFKQVIIHLACRYSYWKQKPIHFVWRLFYTGKRGAQILSRIV